MNDQKQVHHQQFNVPEWKRVPHSSALLVAVLAHLLALPLILVWIWSSNRIHVLPTEFKNAQVISGANHVAYRAKASETNAAQVHVPRSVRTRRPARNRVSEPAITSQVMPGKTLREQAQVATAAITADLRFRQLYGFSRGSDYRLAVQIAGDIPPISPDQLPPHYEQYVTVEVTIDTSGKVAEARIVGGMAPAPVQQTLLSAIREFKYNPATRDGVPIPSQRDIVIHIPS